MITVELRGLDAAAVRALFLRELDGWEQADGSLAGDGWRLSFLPLPDVQLGAIRVRALRVEIDGAGAPAIAAVVRRTSVRGGG